MKKNFVKKIPAAVLALAAALSLSSCYFRAEDKSESARSISVSGTGSVSVKCDMATINVAVVTYNRSVIEAARLNAESVAKVRAALVEAGFSADSITTSDYRIWQDYSTRNGVQIRGDYRVTNSIHIVTLDTSKAGSAIDVAIKNGANEFSSIQFAATKTGDALREARTLAIKNAAEAANLMAKTAGAEVGRVMRIEESGSPMYAARGANKMVMAAAYDYEESVPTQINAGDSEITVTVHCEYELK